MKLKTPLILALDLDTDEEAFQVAGRLAPFVGAFKVGPRLSLRYGKPLVQKLAEMGPVFLDHKYFDIPSTMREAVRASFEMGASLVTVHALAGVVALRELAKLEVELSQIRPFRLLAVTILTSWKEADLPTSFVKAPLSSHVEQLALTALNSGLRGLVCSPHEVALVKSLGHDPFVVTPGIRLETSAPDDQKRIMTPAQALAAGASALVVGRAILGAQDPEAAAREVLQGLGN